VVHDVGCGLGERSDQRIAIGDVRGVLHHIVTGGGETGDEMGADEAVGAGNEGPHGQIQDGQRAADIRADSRFGARGGQPSLAPLRGSPLRSVECHVGDRVGR